MAINRVSNISRISDRTGVGEARRTAIAMAEAAGFNETDAGKLAIAVSEAAANVLHHGKGGEILLRPVGAGIEMLAIDQGPGIANLQDALKDGQSSVGSAGIGLGAIARLASVFDIYTAAGMGTALVAQFHSSQRQRPGGEPAAALEAGVAQSPYPGETECGDAWAMDGNRLLVADGLGHGTLAAQAAAAAVQTFENSRRLSVRDTVEAIHRALRSTRGAAVGIAEADVIKRTVLFCGLGNISGTIASGAAIHGMVSHNGTAGHVVDRIKDFEYAWPDGALLVLHTDGISAKWDLQAYPGLALRRPALVAAVLYRDFRRLRDDATIVVAGVRPQAAKGGA